MRCVPKWIAVAVTVVLVVSLAGCGEQIVYRDAERFPPPSALAGNFLGYSSLEAKRTVCGNCHIGKQTQWSQTKHAGAWSTLKASQAAAPACEGCHSVSSLGNTTTEQNVGWVGSQNARYQDVQCESCHGPGLTHVTNPDVFNTKPLAPLQAGASLDRGCGQCHSGVHRPFAEEWSGSRHARVVASRATNASCVGCHEAKGILQAWGVKSTFVEASGTTDHMAVTCAVCHDPHEKRNPAQLRFSLSSTSMESNLCMKCHYRRAVPEVTSSQGPHSPQGPVLLGEAGWVPPNFVYPPGSLVGTHGSDKNPRLCATCHVNDYTVTDKLTGAFTFRATGHSFQATPCVDGSGIPTGAATCADTEKSFKACATCHLSENGARTAMVVARDRLNELADQVAALLPRIPASEFSTTDNRISTGEGARFNMQLARERGSPAHNPFLIEALLRASIKQIEIDYGIKMTAPVSLEAQLTAR
jgi:predicted CXXCH cytochrome family protein